MVHTGPCPQGIPGGQPSPRLAGEARVPVRRLLAPLPWNVLPSEDKEGMRDGRIT